MSLRETTFCVDHVYSVISVLSPNTGNYGPEKPPYLDTFHAVYSCVIQSSCPS